MSTIIHIASLCLLSLFTASYTSDSNPYSIQPVTLTTLPLSDEDQQAGRYAIYDLDTNEYDLSKECSLAIGFPDHYSEKHIFMKDNDPITIKIGHDINHLKDQKKVHITVYLESLDGRSRLPFFPNKEEVGLRFAAKMAFKVIQ